MKIKEEVKVGRGKAMKYRTVGTNEDLWTAIRAGDLQKVKLLLDAGTGPNAVDFDGWTALMWAAKYGTFDIANFLLGAGADINARDRDGETALDWAIRNEYADIVKLLRQRGAK